MMIEPSRRRFIAHRFSGAGFAAVLGLTLSLSLGLGGCRGRSTMDDASVKRVGEIAKIASERLDALKKAQCKDAESEAKLSELATELTGKFAPATETIKILRQMVDSGCPGVQSTVVIAIRQLRSVTEGKSPQADVASLLSTSLASSDAKLRYQAAMTVYELRIDPRGSKLSEKLQAISQTDPDDRAKQTAVWVREQLEKMYPTK